MASTMMLGSYNLLTGEKQDGYMIHVHPVEGQPVLYVDMLGREIAQAELDKFDDVFITEEQ